MRFGTVTVAIIVTICVARVQSFSISRDTGITISLESCRHRWPQPTSCGGGRSRINNQNAPQQHASIVILHANSNGKEENTIIDAVVEEKTAGLTLNEDDEVNTTVSIPSLKKRMFILLGLMISSLSSFSDDMLSRYDVIHHATSTYLLLSLYRHEKGKEIYSKVLFVTWHRSVSSITSGVLHYSKRTRQIGWKKNGWHG